MTAKQHKGPEMRIGNISNDTNTPPFSINILLASELTTSASSSPRDDVPSLTRLLPSTLRSKHGDIASASRNVLACLDKELDLRRLTAIHDWLWLAGLPIAPRPLHHQSVLGRQICVSEIMDTHLVWDTGKIYIKPLPLYLLCPQFWQQYICCRLDDATRTGRYRRALGFLYSYAALIMYETDFDLAKEKRLLPKEVQWQDWKILVQQLDVETIHSRINPRFHHGELRLGRLNKICFFFHTPMQPYLPFWNQTGAFFQSSFAWLASATVYIAIVLTAMQLGLATDPLVKNKTFQDVSYGFTVFSILGPLVVIAGVVFVFCLLAVYNIASTRKFCREKAVRVARGSY